MGFREKRVKAHNVTGAPVRREAAAVNTTLEVPGAAPAYEPGTLLGAPADGPLRVGATYVGQLADGRGFRCIWQEDQTGFCFMPYHGCRIERRDGRYFAL